MYVCRRSAEDDANEGYEEEDDDDDDDDEVAGDDMEMEMAIMVVAVMSTPWKEKA